MCATADLPEVGPELHDAGLVHMERVCLQYVGRMLSQHVAYRVLLWHEQVTGTLSHQHPHFIAGAPVSG